MDRHRRDRLDLLLGSDFFLGAEFTQVYAKHHGSRIEPVKGATPLTEEKRAQEGLRPEADSRKPATKPELAQG